jgi:hypothetical protein
VVILLPCGPVGRPRSRWSRRGFENRDPAPEPARVPLVNLSVQERCGLVASEGAAAWVLPHFTVREDLGQATRSASIFKIFSIQFVMAKPPDPLERLR